MDNIFVEFLPPWIETGCQPAFYDKESGTVLQQTARMYDRVNMLVRMFNKLSKETKTVVEEYIDKFVDLKNYVEDYFANLDVQEEINNKLDDMAEAGTLTDIIAQYLTLAGVLAFSTVADLASAENLAVGSKAKTYGYKRLGDGVYDLYVVREILNTDVVDGYNIVSLTNTDDLIAERMQSGKKVVAKIKATDNLQDYLNLKIDKTIVLEQDYTATAKVFINSDTTIDLNNHTLTCNYDPTETIIFCYGLTDTFTGYEGYKNITIKNGKISRGDIAMMHNKNVVIENVEFINVNSRHAMQIAGSYNVTVKSCIFNGTSPVSVDSDECINIDPCNYGGQPWMDQQSVMYDHTPNMNITIENNTFKAGEDGHRYTCAMGSHGADDNNQTIAIGVTIRNNDLGSPYTALINTRDWKDVVIENNSGSFATSGVNTVTYGIRLRGSIDNIQITNNIFKNARSVIYFGGDVDATKVNVDISGNYFTALDDTDYPAIRLLDVKKCIIKDNYVNYQANGFYTNARIVSDLPVEGTYCEYITVVFNTFNRTQSASSNCMRIKCFKHMVIDNNNFTTDYSTFSGYAMSITDDAGNEDLKVSNNTTPFIRNLLPSNFFYDYVTTNNNNMIITNGTGGSSTTLTGNGTFTTPLTHFRSLILQLGETNTVYQVELKNWLNSEKFDTQNRTYKIPVAKTDGTLGVLQFSITDSATKYSFTSDLAVRYILAKD